MRKTYNFPDDKQFAFTVFDDTDRATIGKIKPVYDLLYELGIRTTKSVWPLCIKKHNCFTGQTLQDADYLAYILDLKAKGFEIALHNVGSGFYTRKEIIKGLEEYNKILGEYPTIHVNHSSNTDNIYSAHKKLSFPFNLLYKLHKKKETLGEVEASPCFWGDIHKQHIKYTRSHHFKDINTLKFDPYMPYTERGKLKYSNFWFSSVNAQTVIPFNKFINRTTIDRLEKEKGISIVYTHFAGRFVNEHGELDPEFEETMRYLSRKNGLFVPVTELLDFMLEQRYNDNYEISHAQKFMLDFRYFMSNYFH